MGFSKQIGRILQGAFLQTAGSWGATFVLDEHGHIRDDWEVESCELEDPRSVRVRVLEKRKSFRSVRKGPKRRICISPGRGCAHGNLSNT